MTTIASNLELDNDAISALQALCKETRMNPSKTIQAAVLAYRRMRANEKYLGKGKLVRQRPTNSNEQNTQR